MENYAAAPPHSRRAWLVPIAVALALSANKRTQRPPKKHGLMPM